MAYLYKVELFLANQFDWLTIQETLHSMVFTMESKGPLVQKELDEWTSACRQQAEEAANSEEDSLFGICGEILSVNSDGEEKIIRDWSNRGY